MGDEMEAASISTGSFPPISRSQWIEAVRRGGQGQHGEAPVSRSYADLRFEHLRQDAGWTIVQRVDDTDAKRANAQAQEDIAAGATGLALPFAHPIPPRRHRPTPSSRPPLPATSRPLHSCPHAPPLTPPLAHRPTRTTLPLGE